LEVAGLDDQDGFDEQVLKVILLFQALYQVYLLYCMQQKVQYLHWYALRAYHLRP